MGFQSELLQWYDQNKRALPFRETRDPYRIWLSEIILQQTRVNQGLAYYNRFVENFPDVHALADASEQQVLRLWQGLGYYSRARNLHHTAKKIVNSYAGRFPETAAELESLKGIGPYTAAAIASICFGQAVAVLDGNVARVLSRVFALDTPVHTGAGQRQLTLISNEMIDSNQPALYNQAIMELGALVCKPDAPICSLCPVKDYCLAFKNGTQKNYPVKIIKKSPLEIYFNYLVINFRSSSGKTIIFRKRTERGIWHNLYDFPCIENAHQTDEHGILDGISRLMTKFKTDFSIDSISQEYSHQLTHRTIRAVFYHITCFQAPALSPGYILVPPGEISGFPLPRLIERYLIDQRTMGVDK